LFYALFAADFSRIVLVGKFCRWQRNSQRNPSHGTGILALGDCVVDYIPFFPGADPASKGSNWAELEDSDFAGHSFSIKFQYVYLHGTKILYGNKCCANKLDDPHFHRNCFLAGF
jgi:hypothetical protein